MEDLIRLKHAGEVTGAIELFRPVSTGRLCRRSAINYNVGLPLARGACDRQPAAGNGLLTTDH